MAFITIRFLDFIDILLVTLLLYQLYRLLKGTVAFNIIIGLFSLYLLWLIVKLLNMELIGSIMGQFIGVGVLALIIVFHPEIRKFWNRHCAVAGGKFQLSGVQKWFRSKNRCKS